jgi:hypothetical protein
MIEGNSGPKSLDRGRCLALRGEPLTTLLVDPAEAWMMPGEQRQLVVSRRKPSETAQADRRQEQRIPVVWFLRQQPLARRPRLLVAILAHQRANA